MSNLLDKVQADRRADAQQFRDQAVAQHAKAKAKALKGAVKTRVLNQAAVLEARAESHETAAAEIEVLRPVFTTAQELIEALRDTPWHAATKDLRRALGQES